MIAALYIMAIINAVFWVVVFADDVKTFKRIADKKVKRIIAEKESMEGAKKK